MPVNGTLSGLLPALPAMVRLALRVPGAVGLKATLTLQLAPGAKDVPHVVVSVKSELKSARPNAYITGFMVAALTEPLVTDFETGFDCASASALIAR
jgi:hypothetical protein